ncbi:YidC/Oxa1 family membrane protein insertase [Anaerofustis butyriciformans]|uniref:YidC/Oxa1 family membrane protein insertase n=1 Tax=Anaerofustis butyriciformans TaxID=3108533 RepID=UPI002E3673D0|nr:YidC/Oxa1 family membrane protein insertase [Anaerofustis sp. HA2171]
MSYLYMLFGKVLLFLYNFIGNYGLAIILFALFAKIILLPLTYKQIKSTQIMKVINPEVMKIQEKYKNDKAKQGEEMWKVYEKYNYNPMSGCLPLLIQFPIIIGLFGVIRQPEAYVFTEGMTNISMSFFWLKDISISAMDIARTSGFSLDTLYALIIPMITTLATYIQMKQSMANQPNEMGGSMQMMNFVMTLMIGWMSLTFPGALAIYWAATTLLGILQTEIMYKFMPVTAESLHVKPISNYTEVSNGKKKKRNRKR